MRTKLLVIAIVALALVGCNGKAKEQKQAQAKINTALELIEQNRLNQAKQELDSIHLLFPKRVAERKEAKYLQDSISYIEAQRTLAYSDSLLQPLFPQVDQLLKKFRAEKDDKYEDHTRYVQKSLRTDNNTSRCFLQCYVDDAQGVVLKSYYYGSRVLNHEDLELSANGEEQRESGNLHSFEAEGQHEILTIEENKALTLLNFISAHQNDKLLVRLIGRKGNYTYYLSDNEKIALDDTYHLAVLMNDIKHLEEQIALSNRQISLFEQQRSKKKSEIR